MAEMRGCGTWLLLIRLKRSELTSSTGVTSFILKLSFPSPFSAALSPLSPGTMALAAITASAETSPAASDFSAKGEISVEESHTEEQIQEKPGKCKKKKPICSDPEPTNGGAVSHCLFQLVDERGRGPGDRTNQVPFFRKREVKGEICSREAGTLQFSPAQ